MTPSLFSPGTAARWLGYLFVCGSAVGILTLVLPHDERVRDLPLYGLAVVAVTVGLVIVRRGERVASWELHSAIVLGSLILTAANYWVGPTALYPIIYSWTALYAFTFFSLRAALLHVGFIGAGYGVVLLLQEPSSPHVRWVLAVGTPLVAGVLISRVLELAAHRTLVLHESEARTRAIVDGAPDAFAAIEPDGTVVSWNRAAERMFGVSEREARGRDVAELMFAPGHREAHAARRAADLARSDNTEALSRQVEMVRGDGSSFPAEIQVSHIRQETGTLIAFFVRDVSDREQRQREREQLVREQAAREDAEQIASVVNGLQALLDAALPHSRLGDMLEALVPRLQEVLSADAATILLRDGEGAEVLEVAASTAPQGEDPVRIPFGQGISGKVAASRSAALVNDAPPGTALDPATSQCVSVLSVPLLAGGHVTGVIQVGLTGPRYFAEEDLLLLGLAADRVALAIDHARVYEREHRIAETLQRTLLPESLPQMPGLEVAARYRPAASEAEVGGDWYDVIPIAGGRVGLVMGDVAGKGLAAASMVGRLRSAMRAYALEGHDVATVVTRLNQLVWSEVGDSEMATLLYLVVDPAESTVEWVNAGHLPPVAVDATGGAHFLDAPSAVPLGVMPFPVYEATSRPLPPGSTILLYTDGLVERPRETLDLGLKRLAASVQMAGTDPESLCGHVLQELVPEGGASDDVALLALHAPQLSDGFRISMAPEPDRLASLRALMRRWLRHAAAGDEDIAEILAATGEAAANAIEHSGGGREEPFEVEAIVEGGEVDITVRDFGTWRPEREEDRGRGLGLMRALMDKVDVTPSPEGTTVRLRRRLRRGARA